MLWLVLVLFADQFDTTFRAGLIALNQNDFAVAESRLEEASRLEPKNSRVWLALAQTYWRLHKAEKAQSAATSAEGLAADAVVLHGLEVFYSETANRDGSVRVLQAEIRRGLAGENDYFELAQLHLKGDNFAAALEALDAGRKKFDKSAQLELAAGVAYYGLRRFPEAMDAFLRTIRLDPSAEQPYVFLGRMVDQAEERLPKITAVFAEFARREPDNYLSSFLYGKSLVMGNEFSQAEPLLRRSVALHDGLWESHFELGVLLEQGGHLEEAAREIRRGAELNPEDAPSHYHLARLYDRLGKPAEARSERDLHAKLSVAGRGVGGIK